MENKNHICSRCKINNEYMKTCSKCAIDKTHDNFYKSKTCKNNISSWCKECDIKKVRNYYYKNKDKILEKVRCDVCDKFITKTYMKKHQEMESHISNLKKII